MSLVEQVAKPVTRSRKSLMYGASTAFTRRFLSALSAAWNTQNWLARESNTRGAIQSESFFFVDCIIL